MIVKALLRYLRIAPRKVRLVSDLIRKKKALEAQTILNFTTRKASLPLLKLLNQALASAKNNLQLEPSELFISKITVDEGPKLKRWRARARGQAYPIQKKTSHVTLVLDEIEEIEEGKGKKKKARVLKEDLKEIKREAKPEMAPKAERPKPRPDRFEAKKPKVARGLGRIFRRKAI